MTSTNPATDEERIQDAHATLLRGIFTAVLMMRALFLRCRRAVNLETRHAREAPIMFYELSRESVLEV